MSRTNFVPGHFKCRTPEVLIVPLHHLCPFLVTDALCQTNHHPFVSLRVQIFLLDGFDPLLLLFRCGCRYSVNHMVTLDDAPIRLRLAGFDDLAFVVGVVKLKAVLDRGQRAGQAPPSNNYYPPVKNTNAGKPVAHRLPGLLHLPDAEIFQRDDPPRLLVLKEGRMRNVRTRENQSEEERTKE